jgi:hypothetical protein
MAFIPAAKTHKHLYKMVVAVCLVASACAIALVHAVVAAHILREE